MGRLFDFPPALGDISGLQGPFCPDKFLFPIQQIVSLPEFFMDGHVAQPRMSWRHFHVARLANAIERSHLRLCAVLVLLSLACFLPGFSSLQPMDRDEPRYAQASKQMLESGDLVDIRFQDEARHKKPVGIYWLQSATVAIGDALGVSDARTTIALYRIPSLLGAIATVLLTYWAALAFIGRRGAFLAAAFMATSIILMVEARLAKTDAALTACAVATMGGSGAGLSQPGRRHPAPANSGVLLARTCGGDPDQGPAGADVRRSRGCLSVVARKVRPLAARLAADPWRRVHAPGRPALVRRHRHQERGSLLLRLRRA